MKKFILCFLCVSMLFLICGCANYKAEQPIASYSDGTATIFRQPTETNKDEETAENSKTQKEEKSVDNTFPSKEQTFIINTNSKVFHLPSCSAAKRTKKENKTEKTSTLTVLKSEGYTPCKLCLKEYS